MGGRGGGAVARVQRDGRRAAYVGRVAWWRSSSCVGRGVHRPGVRQAFRCATTNRRAFRSAIPDNDGMYATVCMFDGVICMFDIVLYGDGCFGMRRARAMQHGSTSAYTA